MNLLNEKENYLNSLLNGIGDKLQLNKTRHERAEQSYQALCSWLQEDDKFFKNFDLDFYPQGSYKIGTTVKPLSGEEFDLDFVLEIHSDWQSWEPLAILKELERRLKENDTYKPMTEVKNRCIRVNYKDDFHVDILPAYPSSFDREDTKLKVPDRTTHDWADSNPKGYSEWFNEQSSRYDQILFEERMASIEPLSAPIAVEPLKRAVQLLKRHRDIYYQDKEGAPRSIILTTLAAQGYNGELGSYEALDGILSYIGREIQTHSQDILEIYNPANLAEKLSEKWDDNPGEYRSFCDFIKSYKSSWLKLTSLNDYKEISVTLQSLFGESVTKEVILEHANYVNSLRSQNLLGVDPKLATLNVLSNSVTGKSSVKGVAKNTFFGD